VSIKDMGKLFGQVQEMQSRMAEMQSDLAQKSFEGTAGGGMVTAVVTGELRVREIRIEPSLFESGDRDMIQDLTAAAINAALANAQQGVQDELQRINGGMGLPGFAPGSTG
jgi:DNA-binding YbaB/EbfC family protein